MATPDPKPLFKELRNTAREAARVQGTDREAILSRRRALRRKIAALPFDGPAAAALSEFLAHSDSRLERLEHRDGIPENDSQEIMELRADLCWLPQIFSRDKLPQALRYLDSEVKAVRPEATELAVFDGGRAADQVKRVFARLVSVQSTKLGDATAHLAGEEAPDLQGLWCAYLEARDLKIRTGRPVPAERELRDRIEERVLALPPPETADSLEFGAAEFDDIALDLLASQADAPPGQAADEIEGVRRDLAWVRNLVRDELRTCTSNEEDRGPARQLRKALRRLNRTNRKMVREAQELRLQARQEEIFGTRAVAWFENLILWLILLVMVVLIVEAVLPDPWPAPHATAKAVAEAEAWRPVHRILAWIDAAICAVFLVEFFGKLMMVKGKLSWFRRHFLVDLIPSIPYGLIAAHSLDSLRAGRLVRFARLPRLLRYIRFARPLIRFARFFGFLQRGIDRLIRLHGALLNRNIVLFEPARTREGVRSTSELGGRLRLLRARARRAWRRTSAELDPTARSRRIRGFLGGLPEEKELLLLPTVGASTGTESGQFVRAEELIRSLTDLDGGTVEASIGQAAAARISATLERLDAPLLRDMPLLRQMIPAARVGEAVERVAAAGKALGRYIQKRLGGIHWISDLSGVITGPQFLDRVGAGMVQATERPAKRLLLFGLGFVFFRGLVHLMFPGFTDHPEGVDVPFLVSIADWLERTLGTPFLVLGVVCLVILTIGRWFRRVAGEATDFYNRTAEAQYLNLLKEAKLAHQDEDLELLWDRVLRPEFLISRSTIEPGGEALKERFTERRSSRDRVDRVLKLYDDYLDGALFHITDTKTSSQFLGNIALESIRTHCLGFSRRERRRLEELDLDRQRSAIRGPYLWFRSVTHSITQWTARLILEYNHHAISEKERANCPEPALTTHKRWLERKLSGASGGDDDSGNMPFSVTTWFSALHFLTVDEDRDRAVAEEFGERTLKALQADRQAMIRTVFGTYPFHRRARSERTINPFQLYYRYLAGGKVLFLPFYFLGALLKAVGWLLHRIRVTLHEILHPGEMSDDGKENWASYDVAVRKIGRMRKPLYMECARFRALFDPEYLGVDLIPGEDSGLEGRTYREDLEQIGAWDVEWDDFESIRSERDKALAELEILAERAGGPEILVRDLGAPADQDWREAWRALSIAVAVDYRGGRSLHGLDVNCKAIVREVVEKKGRVSGCTWWRRITRLFLPGKVLSEAWGKFETRYGFEHLSPEERQWVFRAVRADYRGLKRLVQLGAALPPDTTPRDAAREIFHQAVARPENWSEQLVTLRAVQSLSVLDVRNYRRQVWALGGYGSE